MGLTDSWNRSHRRHRLVHAVLEDIARTGRPEIASRFRAGLETEFGDLGGFLRDVRRRWYRAFDARLDAVLEQDPDDLTGAVAEVRRAVDEAMPAARLLLDAHTEHPALEELDEHHRRTLLAATGLTMQGRRHDRDIPA
jgi:hypothetical protein